MWNRISEVWCKSMHAKAMWPIHGKYICPDCFRQFPVAWEEVPPRSEVASTPDEALVWSKPAGNQLMGRLKRFGTM
jgi:hypothetical protein